MRFRFLLVCVSAGLFGGGFAIQACGSTEEASAVGDAGVEAAADARPPVDSSLPDVKDSAPACDPTRDFLKDIPDASIADGATTTGICVGCAKQKCKMDIDNCAKDCPCQNLASGALECYLKTQAITCGAPFFNANADTRAIGLSLVGCIQEDCKDECAADSFNPDAGDAGDADAN
jgi:hypothetical protein